MVTCDALKANGKRCWRPAKWMVLTLEAEREVCGVHARALAEAPTTLAMEPAEGTKVCT